MYIKRYVTDKKFNTNTYLVVCENCNEAIIIDPSNHCDEVIDYIEQNRIKLKYLINTHTHPDHCAGNHAVYERFKPTLMLSKPEEIMFNRLIKSGFISKTFLPYKYLYDGDTLSFGNIKLSILETPGHTPGSISIVIDNNVFVGDLIMNSSTNKLEPLCRAAITEKILSIKSLKRVVIFPGHGLPMSIKEVYERLEL